MRSVSETWAFIDQLNASRNFKLTFSIHMKNLFIITYKCIYIFSAPLLAFTKNSLKFSMCSRSYNRLPTYVITLIGRITKCLTCWFEKWKVLIAQLYPTLCDPMDYSLPGSSVYGIIQARILEWVAIPYSKGIFPTQGSNPGPLHYRWILFHLSHQGSPIILEWVAYPFQG